jgi:threonylcarbamoyladenosine tRNA methylthiotransferase MtaB
VRARPKSRSVSSITENVRQVIDAGYNEFVLTGVNIGRYDDNGMKLGKLLEDIVSIPGDFRVRISSIEPDGFTDAFFSMLEHDKIMPHLHLCLQSGSERILRNMRRMYTAKQFMQMIEHVRARIPAFNFTTDVMVGFPDETAEDLEDTLTICKQAAFSHIHTFKYSKRTGTRAERMDHQIPEPIKKERSAIVRDLADRMKLDYMNQWPGHHEEMLVERIRDGRATGYGKHYLPLEADATGLSENQVIPVKIENVIPGRDPKLHVSPAH